MDNGMTIEALLLHKPTVMLYRSLSYSELMSFIMKHSKDDLMLIRLGFRIRKARLAKGMSQYQLALNCDMEKATISRIESGKVNISYLVLCRLCRCLEISIQEFAEEIDESSIPD